MYCPQCGTPNESHARFCKSCAAALSTTTQPPAPISAPPRRPGWWKRQGKFAKLGMIVGAAVVLIIILVASAAGGKKASTTTLAAATITTAATTTATTTKATTTTRPTTTTTNATTTTKAAVVGTRQNPIPIGTLAQCGDWKVKVTGATLDAWDIVKTENQFNDPPADGNQYVLVSVEATYEGSESGTFWIDVSSKFLGSGGNTYDAATVVAPDSVMNAGEVFPGASVSVTLPFEVPSAQVSGGALILGPSFSFSTSDRLFFAVE